MKNTILVLFIIATSIAASARSLNVVTSSATYSFPSADMGNALVQDASTIEICGRTFQISDILSMGVVEEDMADNQVTVTYTGDIATVMIAGNIAQYIDSSIEGAHVSIIQSSLVGDDTCGEITYALEGETSNGSFTLTGSYKSSIDLLGVNIVNPSGAAIDIQNSKRIELSVKSGTTNYLTDGADGSQKAALYCKGHLELKGKGSLTISGKKGHAISAKEYITMKNCTIVIDEAVKDGINCAQYFLMESGDLSISGIGDDAIQVDYKDDVDREAEDTGSITIVGGKITATVTNRASKALKSEGNLTIDGGTLDLTVTGGGVWDSTKSKTKASSCLNSDADIQINGGTLTLVATGSGGKGISCDGNFIITDGNLDISTSGGVFAYVNNQEYDNYTGNTDNLDSALKSSAKGIKADTYLQIDGGNINIVTTGINAEGIESKGELVINGGAINVNAHDDAINSSSHMHINGGEICVIATDNDGLDSNGNLYLNGGIVRAFGAGAPECGIDANEEGGYSVIFTGGTLIGVGGGNSTPRLSVSTQPFITCNATVVANDIVRLLEDDTVLVEFVVPAEYLSMGGGFPGGEPGEGFEPGEGDFPGGEPGEGFEPGEGDFPGGEPGEGFEPGEGDFPGGEPGEGFEPGEGDFPGGEPGEGVESGEEGFAGGGNPGHGGDPGHGGGMGNSGSLLITCPELISGTSYTVEIGTATYTVAAKLK